MQYDNQIDRIFFDDLFWLEVADLLKLSKLDKLEVYIKKYRVAWRNQLMMLATAVFVEAAATAPRTVMRRVRATSRARSLLDGMMVN